MGEAPHNWATIGRSHRWPLHGHVTAHHRFMLRLHWAHIESLDRLIADLDQQIEEKVRLFSEIISLLDRVPDIGETAAKSLIAEIGVAMDQFPDQYHLASWGGHVPRQQRECRQAQERDHRQRQPLVTRHPRRARLCRSPRQALLPVSSLSSLGIAKGNTTLTNTLHILSVRNGFGTVQG